jgi:hypothetical protein
VLFDPAPLELQRRKLPRFVGPNELKANVDFEAGGPASHHLSIMATILAIGLQGHAGPPLAIALEPVHGVEHAFRLRE